MKLKSEIVDSAMGVVRIDCSPSAFEYIADKFMVNSGRPSCAIAIASR